MCRWKCRGTTTTASIGPGNHLFAESLVALDLKTGKRKWHYQTVHHGLWDTDLPCAPILYDMVQNGRKIKVLAQPTKTAFLFVLNRETGEPIWPIEERPVPQSDLPGEKTSPTQPFPTKPPPFDRQGVSIDDLIDFTPQLRAEALEIVKKYKIGPLYTPPMLARPDGPLGTLYASERGRWRELAGRLVRSGNQPSLHPFAYDRGYAANVPTELAMPGPKTTGGILRPATEPGEDEEDAPGERRCRGEDAELEPEDPEDRSRRRPRIAVPRGGSLVEVRTRAIRRHSTCKACRWSNPRTTESRLTT